MNDKIIKLTILLLIIDITIITMLLIGKLSKDYVCNNTTDINWFIENCEVRK